MAEQFNGSSGRLNQRKDHTNGRTFPRAVRTEKPKNVTALDLEVHILRGPPVLVALAEIECSKDDVCGHIVPQLSVDSYQ